MLLDYKEVRAVSLLQVSGVEVVLLDAQQRIHHRLMLLWYRSSLNDILRDCLGRLGLGSLLIGVIIDDWMRSLLVWLLILVTLGIEAATHLN